MSEIKFSQEFTPVHCCMLKSIVETNGYQGGDSGHGSYTKITFIDEGSTDISVRSIKDGFEINLGGDAELEVIKNHFRKIADFLDKVCLLENDHKER